MTGLGDAAVTGFTITALKPRWEVGAVEASGRVGGLRFEALVFRTRAGRGEWELHGGRVGMLRLRDGGGATVFHWDRRMLLPAATGHAGDVADLLAAHLAEHLFHE